MLNAIVSRPAAALASRIAWRSVPGPESFVLVTVNVAAAAVDADAARARAKRLRMVASCLRFYCDPNFLTVRRPPEADPRFDFTEDENVLTMKTAIWPRVLLLEGQ